MSVRADGVAYAPRGLNRDEAARWVGVSPTKFDELVASGRMPKPKRVDGRVIWDRLQLDAAFSDLGEDRGNRIDALFARRAGDDQKNPGWEYLENPVIDEAAAWIAKHRLEIPYPPIPFIREKFDFSNKETIEAFERANAIRRRGND